MLSFIITTTTTAENTTYCGKNKK